MKSNNTYTTIQGDTWDYISYKVYGSELYAYYLMQNNLDYLDILVFSAGTVLSTPELPAALDDDLPPWRMDDSDEEEYDFDEDDYDPYDE